MPRSLFLMFVLLLAIGADRRPGQEEAGAPKNEPRSSPRRAARGSAGQDDQAHLARQSISTAPPTSRSLRGKGSVKILGKGKAGVPDKNPEKVGDTQIEIELKLDAKSRRHRLSLRRHSAGETKPHPVLVETSVPVIPKRSPTTGSGRRSRSACRSSSKARSVDPRMWISFASRARRGKSCHAEVLASRHGSPLDAILTLYDAKWQQIAVNDDFAKEHRDAKIETTLPADGVYYLSLIDAHDSGSNLHVYRLAVK